MRFIRGKEYTLYLVKAVIALIFVGVIFLFAVKVKAADDHLVINEVYPNPNSGENEWVEIYNSNGDILNMSDFKLKKSTSATAKTLSDIICGTSDNHYYVCDLGSSWLPNTGATLTLSKDSIEIDSATYESFDDRKGKSFSRIPNGSDSDDDEIDFRILSPSKGSENILPPPTYYSDKIYINELLPQPATGSADEYIELYNSSDKDEYLINWQLDAETFAVSTIIKAKEYRVFRKSEFNIGLTDTGDTTNLIDPNGEIKSTITYGKTKRGQSYSKFGDNWQWTAALTPATENILTTEIDFPDQDIPILQIDISGARSQPDGETVSVIGIVSVPPGRLSSQYFYIQDGNAGIQIYNYNKIFPALNAGDEVKITGEMATISGERRIKISELSDIVILSSHPPPEAEPIEIDQINKSFEGEYVRIVGTVVKTSGSTFYLHGRGPEGAPLGGEIQVSIRAGTGIKKPKMKVGDVVEVAGILSQYGDTYRLLPIVQSDVKIVKSSGLPKSGPGLDYTIIISIILSWITLAILRRKQRL